MGTGVTALTGANTYTGGTTIADGTLQIGDGGTSGSIVGNVTDDGTLAFDHSDVVTVGADISGSGGVTQDGSGTIVLTGKDTYTGATLLNAGVFEVNGSIASSAVTVNSGATLLGCGTVGSTSVKSGGTITPGGSAISTLNVHGNLSLAAGSTYLADVSVSANDEIAVSGTTNLAGALSVEVVPGAYQIGDSFKLVDSTGALTGTFSNLVVSSEFSHAIGTRLAYDGNDAYLLLVPNTISQFLPSTATTNDIAVAKAIDAILQGGDSAAFAPHGINLSSAFLNLLLDPFIDARGGIAGASGPALAFAPQPVSGFHVALSSTQGPQKFSFGNQIEAGAANTNPATGITASAAGGPIGIWASAYGATSNSDGDASLGSHNTHANQAGFAVGLDVRVSDSFVTGLAGGGANLNWRPSGGLGSGIARVSQGGFYMSKRIDEAYLSLAANYSNYAVSTSRTVVLAGLNKYTANFDSHDYGMRLEGGDRLWNYLDVSITPYGALTLNNFTSPGYAEKTAFGSSAFALRVDNNSKNESLSELGFKLDTVTQTTQIFNLHAGAAWQYDFSPGGNLSTDSFAGLPGPSFTVQGPAAPRNAALVMLAWTQPSATASSSA